MRHAVLLEHGCEQTHNDAVRRHLAARGLAADRFGWASVQIDGGIARVRAKVAGQFEAMAAARARKAPETMRTDGAPAGTTSRSGPVRGSSRQVSSE